MLQTEPLHLEVRGVYCRPPARPALNGVDLSTKRGSFLAITGANGSGKGTLCRCLARFFKESHGQILLNGTPLPNRPEDLPELGMMVVLQGSKVFPEMSVRDNLFCAPAAWRKSHRRERLDSVIQLLPHLKERFHQNAGTLSGGEQQMVAIGRALMAGPSLLILEEPSLGLSTGTTNHVYAALSKLCSEGGTVIVTEETLSVASRYVNGRVLMSQGTIGPVHHNQILAGCGDQPTTISACFIDTY